MNRRAIAGALVASIGIAAAIAAAGAWRRRSTDPRSPAANVWRRNAALAGLGARVGATYATTAARKTFASTQRRDELDRERELRSAEQVAERLGDMKGALMKLGQMASYLDDGLPQPMRDALATLQSDAPPMAVDLAIETLERELGRSVDDAFVEFDPEPIAAASIGQVHRAILADEHGRERAVAVKVQYPGIADTIAADLRNADMLGTMLRTGFRGLDPSEMVDEIKARITEEVDYRREATNQTQFADYYRGHPFIRVPDVVASHSTSRVLTTDLADGFAWSELLTRDQETRDHAAEVIFRFVFRSLYRMGAFNGDPHPGNYRFHDDGTVTFLDFGLVKHFTPSETATFASMVRAAVVDRDHARFREIVEGAGMLRRDAPVSTEDVGRYFGHFYESVREDRSTTWTPEYATSIVRHTFDRSSPISQYATVPRAFVFIQRINLGLYALLGELGARGNYRRIAEELWPFVDAPPSTDLGHAEHAWGRVGERVVGR